MPSSPMFTSGARATEHANGSVLFSTLTDYAADPAFPSESLSGGNACIHKECGGFTDVASG